MSYVIFSAKMNTAVLTQAHHLLLYIAAIFSSYLQLCILQPFVYKDDQ
jgi:hypothetical protein